MRGRRRIDCYADYRDLAMKGKLVRDKIPTIIEKGGKMPITHVAGRSEYLLRLNEKLVEEAKEFSASSNKEELADLMEVFMAICKANKISEKEIAVIRRKKRS